MGKNVLIVAAHPDDEILGCGGTAARLANEGNAVFTLILGEGITARDDSRDRVQREAEITTLKNSIHLANHAIGVRDVFIYDFPDNRFDSVPLLDIVKIVEKIKTKLKPQIILTHYGHDLNIDHRITYRAVLTASRPLFGERVNEIYAFEVLSSTEWNYPTRFSPNYFVDISQTLDRKIDAMSEYRQELREYPHPRSLKGIRLNAEYWGMRTGRSAVEAFEVVRSVQ
ncbi:MAG: PIG-L deacetylase family protein [Candidatus Omnitrophota bacterium]